MAGSFIWYELVTPDPDASKVFYDAVVGWDIEAQPSGAMDYRMITRSDGGNAGGVLRLTDEMKAHGARPIWLAYLHVDDVDATAAAIARDGGAVHMGPFDIDNVGRVAMVTDPAGAPFYIMTPTPPSGQPDAVSDVFDPVKAEHVRWNELATADQDGAVDFYTRHFGWTQEGAMPMGEIGEYKFIQHDGTGIGAIMRKMPQSPASAWTFYIGVDDIDRAFDAARAGGATILYEPMEVPGGEFSGAAVDPQGAAFGLVGPRNG